jgi:YHS domain-containing protein
MKRVVLITFLMFLGLQLTTIAQDSAGNKKEAVITAATPVNSICPVSGEDVDGDITHTHKGKIYAVCCKSCLKKFEKNPDKYISRLSDDGKSIKKTKGDKK